MVKTRSWELSYSTQYLNTQPKGIFPFLQINYSRFSSKHSLMELNNPYDMPSLNTQKFISHFQGAWIKKEKNEEFIIYFCKQNYAISKFKEVHN